MNTWRLVLSNSIATSHSDVALVACQISEVRDIGSFEDVAKFTFQGSCVKQSLVREWFLRITKWAEADMHFTNLDVKGMGT